MAKGFFTQSACVLLDRPASLDAVVAALADFEISRRIDESENWTFAGPLVVVPFRPEANGYATVDVVDRPWPDHMGDPEAEPHLFGAWSIGQFGPLAFPGGLERAGQQAWAWDGGRTAAAKHAAFARVRLGYAFGAAADDPVIPADCDPAAELGFVTGLAAALLDLPGAICLFNPNGEVLRDRQTLADGLAFAADHDLPPLDVWCNARLFNPQNGWLVMDTVGNGQLDLPDMEACFPEDKYDPQEVDAFLRNVTGHLLGGTEIEDGDTADGPGNVPWKAWRQTTGLIPPPRRTLRFFPQDGSMPPAELLRDEADEAE